MTGSLARGDIVLTRFPFTDLNGASVRPALIVSTGLIGHDVVLAGISSVLRGGGVSTDLVIEPSNPEFPQTGLRVASVLRMHKLAAVEANVVIRRLGRIGTQLQTNADRILREVLGL